MNKTKIITLVVIIIVFCCLFSSLGSSMMVYYNQATTISEPEPDINEIDGIDATIEPDQNEVIEPEPTAPVPEPQPSAPLPTPISTQTQTQTPEPEPTLAPRPASTPSPTEFKSSLNPGCWKDPGGSAIYRIRQTGKPCWVPNPTAYDTMCGQRWSAHKVPGSLREIIGSMNHEQVPRC